jgi:hypothetical protein
VTAPAAHYERRLRDLAAETARLDRGDAVLSQVRLAIFAIAAAIVFLAWRGWLSPWFLAVPVLAFVAVAARHERLIRTRDRLRRANAFCERGLARIGDRWAGGGPTGERFRNEHHVYANDLDLFGRGSLFDLLSAARTAGGEQTLAGWLLTPAAPVEIVERQHAVRDLGGAFDVRERLATSGRAQLTMDSDSVVAWAEAPEPRGHRWLQRFTAVFAIAAGATAALAFTTDSLAPLLAVVLVQALAFRKSQELVERTLHVAGAKVADLDVVVDLLDVIERATVTAPRLRQLQGSLTSHGQTASRRIRVLHRLSEIHDWHHSLPLLPVGLFLLGYFTWALALGAAIALWNPVLAILTERWRRVDGGHVRRWVAAVAEIEALASLGGYHFDHPGDPFPDIVTGPAEALFDGTGLGHPLLPQAAMVPNDVRLVPPTRLLVVSGSNMSGKSTLLRTVGINTVLALAGAPVRAAALRLTPLAPGATLRIQDSLRDGRSRFYAELTRIRALAEAAAAGVPLLFLLDELFHGTNSHDRVIGAAAVLRSLVDAGAIGLITTHDLALAEVAGELAPRAVNVHFEDWIDGEAMRFDYRMKPGPVRRSNAIALMRAVGLEVEEE